MMFNVRTIAGGVEFAIKVVPGASRDRIAGLLGDALKVAVSAPPEKGKANKAVIALLARTFGIARANVRIISGETQPHKTVRLTGVSVDAVRAVVAQ
jgi:uncharacterized protein (TIGR00251 family)